MPAGEMEIKAVMICQKKPRKASSLTFVLLPGLHQQGRGGGGKWLLCSLIKCLRLHRLLLLLLKVGLLSVLLLLLDARVVEARGLTKSRLRLRAEARLKARNSVSPS